MKPAPFSYADPRTVEEATALLMEHGDAAKVLAGGQSLVPLLNMRMARPDVLVDINRIARLDEIREDDDGLEIGALVRQRTLERAAVLRSGYPLVAEAIEWVGHPQIRNRGTVVGSLAHADPTAELPTVFLAQGGTVTLASSRGTRTVAAEDFFQHVMTTAIEPDEMAISVRVHRLGVNVGTAFLEIARRHGDFALVAVAVVLTVRDSVCAGARVVMAGAGPTPQRASTAEALVRGEKVAVDLFAHAGHAARQDCEAESDIHATAEYRREVVGTLVERALRIAWTRAQAGAA